MARAVLERPAPAREPSLRATASTAALIAAVAIGAAARWWRLGARLYQFDEAFTAVAARRPWGDLFPFLRHHDSHPPLDYVIRVPFASGGYDLFALRAPSAFFSTCALVLFAWWMRRRGWFGALATFVMALNAFQIVFGREARMYALLQLLGVISAMVLAAWLKKPRRMHAVIIGVVVFAGSMDHVSMLIFACGFFVAAGIRTDRSAWEWRGAVAAGLAAWGAVWGPSFLLQARGHHSRWIPPTSFDRVVTAVGRLVSLSAGLEVLAFATLVVGFLCLTRTHPDLARVAVFGFVVPCALIALCGLFAPVLVERTLTLGAWAPCLAIAAIPAAAGRHGTRFWLVTAVLVMTVTVPSGLGELTTRWPADDLAIAVRSVARPGDVVAIEPFGWAPVTEYAVALAFGGAQPVAIDGLPPNAAFRVGHADPTGRIWLASRSQQAELEGAACGSAPTVRGFHIRCVRLGR